MKKLLIKADDLRLGPMTDSWREFFSYCSRESIRVNAGVIGSWNAKKGGVDAVSGSREMFQEVSELGCCELWNHGHSHQRDKQKGVSEFRGSPLALQIDALRLTQNRVEELTGVRMKSFGPPFNWFDQSTILALQHFPEIRHVYYIPYVPGKSSHGHEMFVTCEPFKGVVKPGARRKFSKTAALRQSERFVALDRNFVLQIHPNSWVDGALDTFASFVEHIRACGYVTTWPDDFYE